MRSINRRRAETPGQVGGGSWDQGFCARAINPLLRQGAGLARAPHALRWRLETFGLYMPSYPESRPWWRINRRALRALLRQLPGYARWLAEMQALRRGGAPAFWQAHAHTARRDWENWLARSYHEEG